MRVERTAEGWVVPKRERAIDSKRTNLREEPPRPRRDAVAEKGLARRDEIGNIVCAILRPRIGVVRKPDVTIPSRNAKFRENNLAMTQCDSFSFPMDKSFSR